MKEGNPVEADTKKMRQLAATNAAVTEEDQVVKMLRSLPSSYSITP